MDLNVISFNKITELYTSVNTELALRPIVPGTITNTLAWTRSGNAVQGGETKFPFPWFSDKGEELNPYEELQAVAPEMVNLMATVKEYGIKPRAIPRGAQLADIFGILEGFAPSMLAAASQLQEYHTATVLGTGESLVHAYDGLSFFNTAKKGNPNNGAIETFSNLRTGLNLDKAGLIEALEFLDSVVGPDGLPLALPGQCYILCSTEDQFQRATDLLMGANLATAVGAAAASQSNEGMRGRAIALKMPMLKAWNGGKAWYACKVASLQHRPLIASVKEPPQIVIEGLDPAEFVRASRNVIKYSWRGFWGIDPGYSQLCLKAVEK